MSISQIIKQKFKKTVHRINSPEEAAKIIVKDTREFDVNSQDYVNGTLEQ